MKACHAIMGQFDNFFIKIGRFFKLDDFEISKWEILRNCGVKKRLKLLSGNTGFCFD